ARGRRLTWVGGRIHRGEASVTIRRPVSDVFAVLGDVERTSSWHPAAVEEYWSSEGPVRVGSTRVAVGKSFGVRSKNEAEVTVFEPNRALGLSVVSGPVPTNILVDFSPVDDGTEVHWVVEMRPTGLSKLVIGPALGVFMRQLDRGLQNLKELMDSGRL
ncbi:MAG: SRPBCC family protein, partial [Acidimicrobiia bacterium]